jgi:hypothetical protein
MEAFMQQIQAAAQYPGRTYALAVRQVLQSDNTLE